SRFAAWGVGAVFASWRYIRARHWSCLIIPVLRAAAALAFYGGDALLFALCLVATDLVRVLVGARLIVVAKGKPSRSAYLHRARAALARREPYAELALAEIYREDGNAEAALGWYERTEWRYGPESARLTCATGEMLLALGDDDEASVAFERAVRQSPFLRP